MYVCMCVYVCVCVCMYVCMYVGMYVCMYVLGLLTQVLDAGFWTLNAGLWTLNSGWWALDTGLWTLDSGPWTLNPGCYTLDAGLWTLDTVSEHCFTVYCFTVSEHWTLFHLTVSEQDQNPVFDSAWLNYWKYFGYESRRISWSRSFCRDYWFWRGNY